MVPAEKILRLLILTSNSTFKITKCRPIGMLLLSRRYPISEIIVIRPRLKPGVSYSASQELNHYTIAAPRMSIFT